MADVTLFAGPTACGVRAGILDAGVELRPPACRGDIDGLLAAAERPGVVILCDGAFQSVPAVSHAELCRALDGGWQVWGVSSIGAIRAFELRSEGMRGFGYVYAQFDRYEDFTDDEMCLLHFPEEPYFPVSEALVNVRYALERCPRPLRLGRRAESALLHGLGRLWFGERTEDRIRALLLGDAGVDARHADAFLEWLKSNRVKTIDLVALMAERPWLALGRSGQREL
jgi:hypothetical protein